MQHDTICEKRAKNPPKPRTSFLSFLENYILVVVITGIKNINHISKNRDPVSDVWVLSWWYSLLASIAFCAFYISGV